MADETFTKGMDPIPDDTDFQEKIYKTARVMKPSS